MDGCLFPSQEQGLSMLRYFMRASSLVGLVAAVTVQAGTFWSPNSTVRETNIRRVRASQFLHHATFGPRMNEINELADRIAQVGRTAACEEWIDKQFDVAQTPIGFHTPVARNMVDRDGYEISGDNTVGYARYRNYAWWHRAIASRDQLRQRVAWALAQIFVVNDEGPQFNNFAVDDSGSGRWMGLSRYYDMFLTSADGNYRDLMFGVTEHPNMGAFLSHVKNAKSSGVRFPDENYAREVMQLFSIGLYDLRINGDILTTQGQPRDSYDNEDIQEFAKVFTGFTYAGDATNFFGRGVNFSQPMEMFDSQHEPGPKFLLRGTSIDGGGSGIEDVHAALDNLFEHPNTPPFIARLLIQRLVRSNPSRGYVLRVANAFRGVDSTGATVGPRGDMKAVVKAILLDGEAFAGVRIERLDANRFRSSPHSTERSRLREPVIRYASMLRALQINRGDHTYVRVPPWQTTFNQAAYKSPSVFNFYLPDYQPAGPLLAYTPNNVPNDFVAAPEFEILTDVAANRIANRLRSEVYRGELFVRIRTAGAARAEFRYPLDIEFVADWIPDTDTPENPQLHFLMEQLDLLLCHGTMSDQTRDIIDGLFLESAEPPVSKVDRAKAILQCVLTSPDCAIGQ